MTQTSTHGQLYVLYPNCSRWFSCPPWYQGAEAWYVEEFCSEREMCNQREGCGQPEQDFSPYVECLFPHPPLKKSGNTQAWPHLSEQVRLLRGKGCWIHHSLVLWFFQGTQKICLPYSPTKTLSVKSILRWVFMNRGPHNLEVCMDCLFLGSLCISFPWLTCLALCQARHSLLESSR